MGKASTHGFLWALGVAQTGHADTESENANPHLLQITLYPLPQSGYYAAKLHHTNMNKPECGSLASRATLSECHQWVCTVHAYPRLFGNSPSRTDGCTGHSDTAKADWTSVERGRWGQGAHIGTRYHQRPPPPPPMPPPKPPPKAEPPMEPPVAWTWAAACCETDWVKELPMFPMEWVMAAHAM